MRKTLHHTFGFTLIELLIVVAIIAILAAIAVPNFLEAQVRSKVSRVKNDMRTVANAMEAYRVDYNRYHPHYTPQNLAEWQMKALTTPVAYISSLPTDPFAQYNKGWAGTTYRDERIWKLGSLPEQMSGATVDKDGDGTTNDNGWQYTNRTAGSDWSKKEMEEGRHAWMLWSIGPDKKGTFHVDACEYDPTNGTASIGEIVRLGP